MGHLVGDVLQLFPTLLSFIFILFLTSIWNVALTQYQYNFVGCHGYIYQKQTNSFIYHFSLLYISWYQYIHDLIRWDYMYLQRFPLTAAYVVLTPGVIYSPSGGRFVWALCQQQSGSVTSGWEGKAYGLPLKEDCYLCSHYGNDSNPWCDTMCSLEDVSCVYDRDFTVMF